MQWCGLKSSVIPEILSLFKVTTDAVVWIEILETGFTASAVIVSTDAVVWIEIIEIRCPSNAVAVTTDAVVWIEMLPSILLYGPQLSPLMQWCGLKLRMPGAYPAGLQVTTDAVVWIEILIVDNLNHLPSRPPLIQ